MLKAKAESMGIKQAIMSNTHRKICCWGSCQVQIVAEFQDGHRVYEVTIGAVVVIIIIAVATAISFCKFGSLCVFDSHLGCFVSFCLQLSVCLWWNLVPQ